MADGPVDFAVLGSTPLALLVAGLLAGVHKKSVALVAETHSSFRLTRGFDLSVGPITRPETWALLQRTVPEVRKLIAGFGAKAAIERVDPLLVAETAAGSEMLSHLRYMLLAYSLPIERLTVDGAGATYRVRDALRIRRTQFAAPAMTWLEKSGVRIFPADGTTVSLRKDGVRIDRGEESVEAQQAITADDTAALSYVEPGEREAILRTENITTLHTEPMKALPAPLTLVVDRGLMLLQGKGGTVQALAGGGADALARAGARLGGGGKLRRAGQTGFGALVPADGAPVIGGVKTVKASMICGFGPVAAFLAPAVARYYAGTASDDERAYFTAREAKDAARANAVEFSGAYVLGSAS